MTAVRNSMAHLRPFPQTVRTSSLKGLAPAGRLHRHVLCTRSLQGAGAPSFGPTCSTADRPSSPKYDNSSSGTFESTPGYVPTGAFRRQPDRTVNTPTASSHAWTTLAASVYASVPGTGPPERQPGRYRLSWAVLERAYRRCGRSIVSRPVYETCLPSAVVHVSPLANRIWRLCPSR